MEIGSEPVIVSYDACSSCAASIVRIHHRDRPDIVTEGMSVRVAAEHLIDRLTHMLDQISDHEQRAVTERILADVRGFVSKVDLAARRAALGENAGVTATAPRGEVISVRPLGPWLAGARATALIEGESLEVIRLVVPRGKKISPHTVRGEATVQCLEGRVAFTAGAVTHELAAGDLLHLSAHQPHSIVGRDDASLLMTIAFPNQSSLSPQ